MPLINGLKMACEPCIRGHRSTKCTHASERLMVPVRKPGRPLSSCPHPSSKPCSCSSGTAVTAAIPRKQKCSCGPSADIETDLKTEVESLNSAVTTPISPSKASNPTFRVQKQSAKSAAGRKQPIGQAELERMDSNQINLVSSTPNGTRRSASISSESVPSTPNIPVFGSYDMSQAGMPFAPQSMMFPMFPQPMPSAMTPNPQVPPSVSANGTVKDSTPVVATPTLGSCCGGGTNGASDAARKVSSSPESETAAASPEIKPTKSCCSSRTETNKTNIPNGFMVHPQQAAMPNGLVMSPYHGPVMMPNGMYSYFPQPTIFTYPPQFGSYLQPLQLEQWRQFMALTMRQYPPPEGFPINGPGGATMNEAMNGTMNGILHNVANANGSTPMHNAMNGTMGVPINGAVHPGAHGVVNGAANGATNGTMNGTMNGAMNGMMNVPMNGMIPFPAFGMPNMDMGTSHQCSCGEGCQCVGCAAHPYNEATRNSVRAALDAMAAGSQKGARPAPAESDFGNGDVGHQHNHDTSSNGVPTPAQGLGEGKLSPGVPPSPSDATSGNGDEQVLSANDFFFVSYEFEGECAGETASCPCGDDCQCIGCVIHSIPDPEQPAEQAHL